MHVTLTSVLFSGVWMTLPRSEQSHPRITWPFPSFCNLFCSCPHVLSTYGLLLFKFTLIFFFEEQALKGPSRHRFDFVHIVAAFHFIYREILLSAFLLIHRFEFSSPRRESYLFTTYNVFLDLPMRECDLAILSPICAASHNPPQNADKRIQWGFRTII